MLPKSIAEIESNHPVFYQRLKRCYEHLDQYEYDKLRYRSDIVNLFHSLKDLKDERQLQPPANADTSEYWLKQVKNTSIKTSMGQVSASKGQVLGVQRTGNGGSIGQVYGQVRFETLVNQIISKCPDRYIYEPENGVKTLQHLITFCIALFAPDYEKTMSEARKGFEAFEFPCLFAANNAKGWTRRFETMFDKLWFSSRRVDKPKQNMSIPLWFYANVVRVSVRPEEKRMKTEGQAVTDVELGFIVKKITEAILRAHQDRGDLYRILTNNYFMKAKADFKSKTDRRLNNTKLKRMTTILHDAELIIKICRSNGKKRKPNLYKIGSSNPMAIDKLGVLYR